MEQTINIGELNEQLESVEPLQIVDWAMSQFGDGLVLTTSFGIQSAVMLHLVTRRQPNIPVIWIDTGYLPPDTYRYAERLIYSLNLNIKVFQPKLSPARMEAIYGRLWETNDVNAINLYNHLRKVEPMEAALKELGATAWLAGLRSEQTDYRQTLKPLSIQDGIYKIHPILHWTTQDIDGYMKAHHLPQHPLVSQGYATVGDWHSSRPLQAWDKHERQTRFQGLKQECGLHLCPS